MSWVWGLVTWVLWTGGVGVVAVLQGRDERWLAAFLGTSALVLLDLGSLKAFAQVVLAPPTVDGAPRPKNSLLTGGVIALRLVPWVGLAFLMKTIPPTEVPVAHLLGWATFPGLVLGMGLLPRIFRKETK